MRIELFIKPSKIENQFRYSEKKNIKTNSVVSCQRLFGAFGMYLDFLLYCLQSFTVYCEVLQRSLLLSSF